MGGMGPRTWKVTVAGRTVAVVAGTREAAERIAAQRRSAQAQPARDRPAGALGVGHAHP
jgi:hypothetical protein